MKKMRPFWIMMWIILGMLALAACSSGGKPGAAPQGDVTQVSNPAIDDGTPAPTRDPAKIIISQIEFDQNQQAAVVVLFLPVKLDGAEVYANNEKVAASTNKMGDMLESRIEVPAMVRAKDLNIVFKAAGADLATCTLKTSNNATEPSGDCGW